MSDGDQQLPILPEASFTFGDPEKGEVLFTVTIDLLSFWLIHAISRQWGIHRALDIVRLGADLVKRELTEDDIRRMEQVIQTARRTTDRWKTPEEMALAVTYRGLRQKKLNRDQAAKLAEAIIEKPIDKEAWRKAVDRWASKNHYPKVDLRKPS